MGCFFVNINLYGAIAQHGYSRVQKGDPLAQKEILWLSLACALYCKLDVSVNRVQMLVEQFCVCSLQTYAGVVHIPPLPARSNWRDRQGLFLYVGHDNIRDHCADWQI